MKLEDKPFWTVPIHSYDVRYYFEHPDNLEAEIHCYRIINSHPLDSRIVLRICFYSAPPLPTLAPESQYELAAGEQPKDRVELRYGIDRFPHIHAILRSGAPLEFVYDRVGDNPPKLYHRLHANAAIGLVSDTQAALPGWLAPSIPAG